MAQPSLEKKMTEINVQFHCREANLKAEFASYEKDIKDSHGLTRPDGTLNQATLDSLDQLRSVKWKAQDELLKWKEDQKQAARESWAAQHAKTQDDKFGSTSASGTKVGQSSRKRKALDNHPVGYESKPASPTKDMITMETAAPAEYILEDHRRAIRRKYSKASKGPSAEDGSYWSSNLASTVQDVKARVDAFTGKTESSDDE